MVICSSIHAQWFPEIWIFNSLLVLYSGAVNMEKLPKRSINLHSTYVMMLILVCFRKNPPNLPPHFYDLGERLKDFAAEQLRCIR